MRFPPENVLLYSVQLCFYAATMHFVQFSHRGNLNRKVEPTLSCKKLLAAIIILTFPHICPQLI